MKLVLLSIVFFTISCATEKLTVRKPADLVESNKKSSGYGVDHRKIHHLRADMR